jgi:serine phosphatase RsbU (regulator of sigma subunit)
MSREEAIALIGGMQEAANAHDAGRMASFYAEEAVAVSPVFGEVRGREAVVGTWKALFETVPDSSIEVTEVLADGDRIGFLGTVRGTDRAGWFGLPATGAPFHYRVTLVCTMAGEKIVREERLYDAGALVERLEKARIDKELQTAAEVQNALLRRTATGGPHWEVAGDSIPCRAIGGDFFEFLDLPSGDLAVALGDVEGNGTPAALVAAMLHGMFVAEARAGQSPAATLLRMNRQLVGPSSGSLVARKLSSRFATLIYGVLSPGGRFVYSNAGHVPPALLGRRGVRRLTAGGPILGAFPEASFQEGTLQLEPGDTLLMLSDGVTEASNAADEEFGEARPIACAVENAGEPPVVILDRLLGAVREFCGPVAPADDITATVTRFR